MNKILEKVAKLTLGLAMAAGVGVAVSAGPKDASPAQAAETPGSTQTLTITRSGFSSTTASYAWYDWSVATSGGTSIGGKAEIYASTSASMQFNKGKGNKQGAIFNTTALPGSITKIEATTASGTNRTWNAYTTSTACSLSGTSLSFGSNKTTVGTGVSITTSSTTIGASTAGHSYFCIQENVSSASYIAQFKITYTVPGTKYKVTFNANNTDYTGSTPSAITQSTVGGSITLPAALSCTGYDWLGWNTSSSGGQSTRKTAGSSYTPEDNITLYGEWQKKNYTVDGSEITGGYLSSTASISHGDPLDIYLVASSNYALPNSITVKMGGSTLEEDTDYTYDDPTESNPGEITILEVTGNIEISAACVPQGTAYTVTYNANDGTVSPTSEEVVENGHPAFPTPTRSGYNFKGWQVNGSGTAYTDSEDYTVTGDVTFVASWAAVYTVTFNANGGSSSPASQSVESGLTFTFPSAGTKTHYSFDGWTSTGDEPYYAVGATSPAVTGNITYTAHWTEDAKYTVTYSAASPGSGSYAHTNNYGGTYTLLAFASLSGITYDSTNYRFKDYTVDGVSRAPGYQFTLSSAKTITVNFEELPPEDNITYALTDGIRGTATSSWGTDGSVTDSTGASYYIHSMGVSSNTSAVRWNANGYLYTTSVPSNVKLASVSIASITSGKTVNVYASNTAYSAAPSDSALGSLSENSLSYTFESSYKYIALKGTASSTEVGTITISYEKLPELSSVTTSGQKASFKAGENFSYGGTLTAHYTNGKADATVTPTSYKVGASGIDPTSAGTAITTSTTMTIAAHNGKYIYVVYTEDQITKWASYPITVGPADPTGIVLSPSSATIGIDETFSFTDVEVTINPSDYATQDAYEWILVDDLGLDVEFDAPDIEVHEDSNGEPLIIRCRSTVDNSVYADFELTVSGNPIAVLYDANDQDVTSGSASYYSDYGNDIYYHVSATNFGTGVSYTWSSSNSSILSVDDNDGASCGYYIEDGADGTARLSCVVSGSKGSATVYVDVTITPVSVTSVTWNAPSIDVYSGASMSTASWNVRYSTNSGKTDQVPDSYKIFLGDTEIASNHTWTADDDGETLKVKVGDVYSSSTTVKVTQTIHSVVATIPGTPISEYQLVESQSDLEEGRYLIVSITDAKAFDGSLDTLDAGQNNIDVTISDGTVIANDSTVSGKYFDLTVENDAWTITSASGNNVGHSASGNGMNGTGTNTITVSDGISTILGTGGKGLAYNSAAGSSSERFRYYTSPAANANHSVSLFKLVEEAGTPTSAEIANVAAHKEAQRVAVKFAKAFNAAMDLTENCTTGLDAAWTTCTSAYGTFQTEAAALGSEKAYAEYYIKYASCEWSDDSGEACIERMLRTYKACVQVHGKTAFMSDLVSLGAPQVSPLVNIIGENTNTVAIIVIISMVSVTAIGGYFFLRRRKENQ